jgi:hypothetical protein
MSRIGHSVIQWNQQTDLPTNAVEGVLLLPETIKQRQPVEAMIFRQAATTSLNMDSSRCLYIQFVPKRGASPRLPDVPVSCIYKTGHFVANCTLSI